MALVAAMAADEKKPEKPEKPPEVKAYDEAVKIEDPEQKMAAFRRIIADHPKSNPARWSGNEILVALIEKWPDRTREIRAQAKRLIRSTSAKDRGSLYNSIAGQYVRANILLEDAESLAKKSLKTFNEKKFIARQKETFASGKRTPPPDSVMRRWYRSARNGSVVTLGRVYVERGKTAEGEKLLKEALETDSSRGAASFGLARLARKRGDDRIEFDYLLTAHLARPFKGKNEERLNELYSKLHPGSPGAMDALLDEEYRKRFPSPLHAEPYKAKADRGARVVLAEVFTGAGCPPCVAADLAFDVALERYSRQELAVVMYHVHVPRPDPMTNPSTLKRNDFYGVQGVPSFLIEGTRDGGGGSRDDASYVYGRFNPEIEKALENPPGAELKLEAKTLGNTVKVTVEVDVPDSDGKELKLQIALVEEMVRYSGENGIRYHPMVVRSLAGPEASGIALDLSRPGPIEHVFDIEKITAELKAHLDDYEVNGRHGKIKFSEKKHEINSRNLAVVAFVQDSKSKEVLQSIYRKLESAPVSRAR